MQELERMIKIYHTAFIVFLILTILFLVVSVVLFFRFNIRGIFDMRTGRGARKTIQKMQEINAQTGKLRQDVVTHTPVNLQGAERISAPPTEKRIKEAQETEALSNQGSQETALLSNQGSQETTRLSDQGSQETTLLHDYNETTVLSSELTKETPQPESKKLPGAFKIEKEIIWIHTEEML